MIGSVVTYIFMYLYYKKDQDWYLYIASMLNIVRQSIRVWDLEDTLRFLDKYTLWNIMYVQYMSAFVSVIAFLVCFSNKRGVFIFLQLYYFNTYLQWHYLIGNITKNEDVKIVLEKSYPITISFLIIIIMLKKLNTTIFSAF